MGKFRQKWDAIRRILHDQPTAYNIRLEIGGDVQEVPVVINGIALLGSLEPGRAWIEIHQTRPSSPGWDDLERLSRGGVQHGDSKE